jgi:hypothetical protein
MVTTHIDCVNAIHDVMSKHNNGDVDDNDNSHDKRKDAEAQVVDKNAQQTTNVAMEPPYIMIRLTTTETRMNRRIQRHNMLMTPSNKEAMQQLMTPGQMTY